MKRINKESNRRGEDAAMITKKDRGYDHKISGSADRILKPIRVISSRHIKAHTMLS